MQVTSRYPHIDALRGLAALYVIFGHTLNWYFLNISSDVGLSFEWTKQLTSALAGVFLFFAISGYVIPSSFHREGYEGARDFLIRRFFRLYPIFWVSVLPSVFHYFRVDSPSYSLETVLCNFTMVPRLFNHGFVVGVYWSLAHELLFYLICVGLHLVGWIQQSQKIALLTIFFGLGYWLFRLGGWDGGTTFFQKSVLICMSIMFWGALWRSFQDGKCRGMLERAVLMFLPLQSLILAACRLFYAHSEAKMNFPISFAVSIAAGLGVFILGTTVVKLKGRVLVWCGTVSYSLYLFHMFVILHAARFFGSFYPGVPSLLAFAAVVLVCSCTVAAAGYYFVERPSIALGRQSVRAL